MDDSVHTEDLDLDAEQSESVVGGAMISGGSGLTLKQEEEQLAKQKGGTPLKSPGQIIKKGGGM